MDKTYIEINLPHLGKNTSNIIKRYNNYEYYIADLTSDAYNHGLIETVREITKHGINFIMVNTLKDALKVREINKKIGILVHLPLCYEDILEASKNDISVTISNYEYFYEVLTKLKKNIKIHIKLDTGLNRLGIKEKNELENIIEVSKNDKRIALEGLYTELVDSNNIDSTIFDEQINRILSLIKDVNLKDIKIVHIYDNSALINHLKLKIANGVRINLSLFGINPVSHKTLDFKLYETFSLYTEIVELKDVKKDEMIGYKNSFEVKRDMRIAIVPIGFYNNMNKKNIGRNVSIDGGRYKILDAIYDTMITIYVDYEVKLFDKVAIIGGLISIEEVKRYTDMEYEEILNITNIERKYVKN